MGSCKNYTVPYYSSITIQHHPARYSTSGLLLAGRWPWPGAFKRLVGQHGCH